MNHAQPVIMGQKGLGSPYAYRVRDGAGALIRGVMEADSQDEAARQLKTMGYFVVSLHRALPRLSLPDPRKWFERVGSDDLIAFTLQISDMVASGLTLLLGLEIIENQTGNKKLKAVVSDLRRTIEGGQPFSAALERYPQVFSGLYIPVVKAGEAGGKLDVVLKRLSQFLEVRQEFHRRLVSALTYPAFLLCACCIVGLLIVVWVVPSFVEIFTKAGIPLPLPTRILNTSAHVLRRGWYVAPVFLVLFITAFRWWMSKPRGRLGFSRFLLRIPQAGDLIRKVAVARFSGMLAVMISSGVPILESLQLVEVTLGNPVMEVALKSVRKAVAEGENISRPLKASGEFPLDVVQMVAVGEETGRLEEMLSKVTDIYTRAVDYSLKKFITFLEPAILIVMGGLVMMIMLSVFLPILNMVKLLRHGG